MHRADVRQDVVLANDTNVHFVSDHKWCVCFP